MSTVHYFAFICCAIGVISAEETGKRVLPMDCALVRCAAPQCVNTFTPPGQCCPVCKNNDKQGQCPVAPEGTITICLVECQGDDSCPGDQKCCNYGCHVSCTNPVGKACDYKGNVYTDGAQFKDECNNCWCSNGSVGCTKIGCLGKSCNYKGKVYKDGSQFKDECNNCWCSNGSVGCTKIGCLGKPGTCPKPRGPGLCWERCSSDYDCPDVQKCCSNGCGHDCYKPTPPVSGCIVNGVNYSTGATVPSKTANPCEVCTCQNGSVQCEMMACLACVGYTPPGQCCPICGSGPYELQ